MSQNITFDVIARDKASGTFSKISKSADRTKGSLGGVGAVGKKLTAVLGGLAVGSGIVSFFRDANAEAREAQKVGAQTTQVLKSTGGAANVTADEVGKLANAISRKAGIDDEAIQSGENLLLTFTRIRNEAGKGNDVFTQATRTITDMSVALDQDMKSSAIQVGKALNDPIKGVTALQRVGVSFTESQKKQIKALVETGDTLSAQKLILKELNKEFGGSAQAQATAADKAGVAWKNLEEQIGTALIPIEDKLATIVAEDVVPAISSFVSGMQDGTGAGGQFVDVLHDAYEVGRGVAKALDAIPGPIKKFGVEGLIAYGVLRKLSAGSTLLGNSLAMPVARTRQLYAEMTYSETRLQRVGVVSRRLGGALGQMAGAAGMLAVVDGAKRSNVALSTLEMTAGGAAAGFAVGGPLGAAVGGAVGYFGSLVKQLKNTDKGFQDDLSLTTYARTLDGVTAATTRATRALLLERMEKNGLLKQTEALNISDRDAIQAALGNEAARKRVGAALRQAVSEGKNYQALNVAQRLGVETTAIKSSRVEQLKKNLALAATKEEAQKIQAKLDRLAKTHANPSVNLLGASKTISQLNAIQGLIAEITHSKTQVGISAPATSLDGLLGGHRAAGGPVSAGTLYEVNELGMELFRPSVSGQIIPHAAASTAGVPVVINVNGAGDPASVAREVVRQLKARKLNSGIPLGLD